MTRNEEGVRNAMQAIWNEGDISRVSEFYADDFEADYPHTNWGSGLDGICALAAQVHKDLPNYKEDIEELIDAGDKIVVALSISGRHPNSGETISFRDMTILTLKNGKIIRQRGVGDLLSLYGKLGMIDFPSS